MRINQHKRQASCGVRCRFRKAVASTELHGEGQLDRGGVGQAHDTKPTHLKKPGQCQRWRCPACLNKDLIISDKRETLAKQAKQ